MELLNSNLFRKKTHKFQEQRQITQEFTEKQQSQPNQDKNNESIKSQPLHEITYRADIDGLRTIAVSIVVIFHAWPLFMPGGFIGVDIFFVISGYLISGIIIKQAKQNTFSYIEFYSRRIKRIYPALILVLVFVLVVGTRKFLRRPLQIMTQTMAATTVFAANIEILTAQHDYFDPDSKTNPLLHLWSLSVEEQFYIFWPLLLTVTFKKIQNKMFYVLLAYTILSFLFNIICVITKPQFDFYFPFCRFWEMSVGGLVAYMNFKIQNKMISNVLSLISLIIIFITVWIIDENSLFPGFWALIPTLGAAFIIQAGSHSFVNNYILSSKPFVFVGKISYSLYLWHWPLLVFSRILYPAGSKSIYAKPQLMVFIAIVLSIFSYYLVENPFRVRKQRIVPVILFIFMICIGISALYVKSNAAEFQQHRLKQLVQQKQQDYINGMIPQQIDFYIKYGRKIPNSSKNPKRQPLTMDKLRLSVWQSTLNLEQHRNQVLLGKRITEESRYYRPDAKENLHHYLVANQGQKNQVFIIGDSHGRFILHRFQKLYQKSVQQQKRQVFPTIVSIIREESRFVPQDRIYNISIQLIKQFKPKRIFFVYRWTNQWRTKDLNIRPPYEEMQYYEQIMGRFQSELKQLSGRGAEIYLAAINPQGDSYHPGRMFDEDGIIEDNLKPVKLSEFSERFAKYIQILQTVAKNVGAKFVDFSDYMCYQDRCEVLTPNGYSVTFDQDHQTKLYSRNWAGSVDFLTEF